MCVKASKLHRVTCANRAAPATALEHLTISWFSLQPRYESYQSTHCCSESNMKRRRRRNRQFSSGSRWRLAEEDGWITETLYAWKSSADDNRFNYTVKYGRDKIFQFDACIRPAVRILSSPTVPFWGQVCFQQLHGTSSACIRGPDNPVNYMKCCMLWFKIGFKMDSVLIPVMYTYNC
jgi:hypothetical protein